MYEDTPLEIDSHLLQSADLQETLQKILNTLNQVVPADGGHSVVLWNHEAQTFNTSATTVKLQTQDPPSKRVRREGGASRWIVDNREALAVPDIRHDRFGANPMLDEYELNAYLGVPLDIDDKAIGVLYALYRHPRTFTETEIQLMKDFAGFVSITISNIQMRLRFADTNRRVIEKHNQLEALFDAIPDKVFIKDKEGRFIRINKSSVPYYSVSTSGEIIGKTDFDFFSDTMARQFFEDDQQVILQGKSVVNKEEFNQTLDGEEQWMLTNTSTFC